MNMAGWPTPGDETAQQFARLPVTIETIGALRRDSWSLNYDNYVLDDADLAVNELSKFKAAGGSTIVDLTTSGLQPQPERLRAIARASDVNIVVGCGHYIASMQTPEIASATVEDLAANLMDEVRNGVAGSSVRPGIIGELGTSEVIEDSELRVLRAAAIAQRDTGLAINVHTYPWGRTGIEVADILLGEGVCAHKIVISHLDNAPIDIEYHKQLGRSGVWLEYDGFGKEWYVDSKQSWFPRDYERIFAIRELIDAGFLNQIVLGCDVCLKMQLIRYGGWGYAHLAENVPSLMLAHGISESEVEAMLVDNPRTLLEVPG
jgi:phosphotriesterase-related protein